MFLVCVSVPQSRIRGLPWAEQTAEKLQYGQHPHPRCAALTTQSFTCIILLIVYFTWIRFSFVGFVHYDRPLSLNFLYRNVEFQQPFLFYLEGGCVDLSSHAGHSNLQAWDQELSSATDSFHAQLLFERQSTNKKRSGYDKRLRNSLLSHMIDACLSGAI